MDELLRERAQQNSLPWVTGAPRADPSRENSMDCSDVGSWKRVWRLFVGLCEATTSAAQPVTGTKSGQLQE